MTGRRIDLLLRGVLIGGGLAAALFGVLHLLDRPPEEIVSAALWFLVPPVLSDLVLLPAIALVGWVMTRTLAPWMRLPVQVAGILCGGLLVVAAPFLGRPGLRPDNATLLDRNYVAGYLVYVAVIVVGSAGWALWRRRRAVGVSTSTQQISGESVHD